MTRAVAAGAAAVTVALAGCGSGTPRATTPPPPRLPHVLAQAWTLEAEAVASALVAGDGCTAMTLATRLQTQVVAAVNGRRVPRRFLEPLSSGVNDLVSQISCTPPAPAAAPGKSGEHAHRHGKHGKGKGD